MKYIKIVILPFAIICCCSIAATAQDTLNHDFSAAASRLKADTGKLPDKVKTVQVAFRNADRQDLPGNVPAINMEELMKKNYITYPLDGMEALVPGFNGNSLWGTGSYLLLVDGVPRDVGSVMPTEIAQISFLKGAEAVVLYGSRAAKGVVCISTKRGQADNIHIAMRVNSGVNVPKSYPQYLGSAEYMALYNEARVNDGLTKLYSDETIYNYASGKNPYRYPSVDYYSSQYLKKMYSRLDATAEISGGNDKARYYTNIGYWTSGSLLNFGEAKTNDRSGRFNIRGNIDINLNDYISCNVDAAAIFYTGNGVNANYWNSAATLRPYRFTPLIPIDMIEADDDASQLLVKNSNHIIDGKYLLGGTQLDQTNPFAAIYAGGHNSYTSRQFQFNTGVNADLRHVLKGLTFRATMAVDYSTSYNLSYNNSYATYEPSWNSYSGTDLISSLTKYGQDATSGVQNVSNSWYRQTIAATGQFNYVSSIGKDHHLSAMLLVNGYQQSESAVYHKTGNANLGLQLGYNFKHKYYLDFSSAYMHSAKMPKGNREALSPTVTAAWKLSEEPFLSGVTWLDALKINASAGRVYTDLDISDYYLYQGYYTVAGSWYGWKDGSGIPATESRRGDNPDLHLPRRDEVNIGMEASFFRKLIQVNATAFKNKIAGNIIQASSLFPSYFTTYWPVSSFIPYVNYNEDSRKGFDIGININKRIGSIDWTLGASATWYTTMASRRAEVYQDAYQNRQGKPLDGIWGLQSLGFFKDQQDIDKSPAQSFGQVKPGDIKYKDQNGDGIIDSRDEVYLGKAGWYGSPLTWGIHLEAKWKDLSFYALGVGRYGAYGLNNNSYYWMYGESKYSIIARNRWTDATKETATYPRLTTLSSDNNFRSSDFWIYSTNRFDIGKVQLTYDLSKIIGKKKFVRELGVYLSGSNLLTIAAERETLEMNIGSAPQTRFYNLGLKAQF
ncbi:SusC/RagA family TonB-linked outer membrane protein [Chitinophaga sp. Cy-1792]|uniref:SusC/RagA family TonB-linked outer membrane protein n=1 Tax=Chitinophaga sp. Cy-1792 TaxID=2608339 RepID=UPI00141FDCCC|nr:SusC/RagA family TonB-linked outer membrane protein [Chitinophaga sp. Cy-1792]NIG55042.1 SusC/RagA family TonB-linked outer membrane protein [Chitinophaga sp. Cy-1792]